SACRAPPPGGKFVHAVSRFLGIAARRSLAFTVPVGVVVGGGSVVPLGDAVVPLPPLDPESPLVASWRAITASAAARATASAMTMSDGRPRGGRGGWAPGPG